MRPWSAIFGTAAIISRTCPRCATGCGARADAAMNVLAVNCGSSSIKFGLFAAPASGEHGDGMSRLAGGGIERLGTGRAQLHFETVRGVPLDTTGVVPDQAEGVRRIAEWMSATRLSVQAVGHRVVHGGPRFRTPTLLDDTVIAAIHALEALAPLHNGPSLAGIRACRAAFGGDPPLVAVGAPRALGAEQRPARPAGARERRRRRGDRDRGVLLSHPQVHRRVPGGARRRPGGRVHRSHRRALGRGARADLPGARVLRPDPRPASQCRRGGRRATHQRLGGAAGGVRDSDRRGDRDRAGHRAGAPSVRLIVSLALLAALAGCSLLERARSNFWELERGPSGQAPDPATTREAVIQIYAARTVGWRGFFAVHTWIAVKPRDAESYTRYEVIGWGVDRGAPAVRVNRSGADNYWFGDRPERLVDLRGEAADPLIERVAAAVASYPYQATYRTWPGPNSNPFTAGRGRSMPA